MTQMIWRTLAATGAIEEFEDEDECRTRAVEIAEETGKWVGIEEWSSQHPQDELNQGWALVGTVGDTGPRTPPVKAPAPLGQLRDVDEALWRAVTGAARSNNPGTDTVSQALAALLLGDYNLCMTLLNEGIGMHWLADWPDRRSGARAEVLREVDLEMNRTETAGESWPASGPLVGDYMIDIEHRLNTIRGGGI